MAKLTPDQVICLARLTWAADRMEELTHWLNLKNPAQYKVNMPFDCCVVGRLKETLFIRSSISGILSVPKRYVESGIFKIKVGEEIESALLREDVDVTRFEDFQTVFKSVLDKAVFENIISDDTRQVSLEGVKGL